MKQASDTPSVPAATRPLGAWLAAAAFGAAVMFMLDPDRGRRRRRQSAQAFRRLSQQAGHVLAVSGSDASHRWQGVLAQARHLAERARPANDDQLEARVRARLGRLVRNPHALAVHAQEGQVTLAGPVLSEEKPALLAGVGAVPGVREVIDTLDEHAEANGIPALQGAPRSPAERVAALPPAWRALAFAGGGSLGVLGLTRRTPGTLALALLGAALVARASVPPRQRQGQAHGMPGGHEEAAATAGGQLLH